MSEIKIASVPAEANVIVAPGLDPIHVFWMDVDTGKGYVTAICYGCAWTAYFGAMGGMTIRQFFARADVGYMTSKMGNTPTLRTGKRHENYLAKIVTAIKAALTQTLDDEVAKERA